MKNKKKGFTLVEIIVVLVIMAILLAIAIPSILGYVQKAEDQKILAKARNVLLAAKGEAVELYSNNELNRLLHDPAIAKQIITTSDVDGELIEIALNKSSNSSGDFIVKIDQRYVYYNDENHTFTFMDEKDVMALHTKIKNELITDNEILTIINDYFLADAGRTSIDSEGTNFGIKIMNVLQKKGYDTSSFSFRIYRKGNDNTITISTKKIANSMKDSKEKVEVIQYDFGSDGNYQSTPVIKTGYAPVDTKVIDIPNGKDTIPYLKLDQMEWTILP